MFVVSTGELAKYRRFAKVASFALFPGALAVALFGALTSSVGAWSWLLLTAALVVGAAVAHWTYDVGFAPSDRRRSSHGLSSSTGAGLGVGSFGLVITALSIDSGDVLLICGSVLLGSATYLVYSSWRVVAEQRAAR
jgi:hypothetical protein